MAKWINYGEWNELLFNNTYNTNAKSTAKKKNNNNAPQSVKGTYDLSIYGNTIIIVDNADGTTAEAKCHPDDEFNIGIGIEEAFKKLNEKREEIRKKQEEEKKIKLGDWVEVVDDGKCYGKYVKWLYDKVDPEYVCMFDYGNFNCKGYRGRVIIVDKFQGKNLVAFHTKNNKVYIVEDKGLRKVAN